MTEYLVFGAEGCAPCQRLKEWLQGKDIKHSVHDASSDKARSMMVRAVPTVVRLVDGKPDEYLIGFQLNEAKQFFGV